MATNALRPWTVVASEPDWNRLWQHHFPGDNDEHGSVLLCGVVDAPRERRLLVREVVPATPGIDYLPSANAYRALAPAFISDLAGRCERERLAYLAVHNHDADEAVSFSSIDLASHERGYPALLDITRGGPVGALVLGRRAVAGDIWEPHGRSKVGRTVILGARRRVLGPRPLPEAEPVSETYDRQARLFGDAGQRLLRGLKVAVVGAGGAGSLIMQGLAHLGVGHLAVIDDDRIKKPNLPRQAGAGPEDAADEARGWAGARKVDVASRLVSSIDPTIQVVAIDGNIVDQGVAENVLDADAIFLAADSMQARHVVNAISHQYLIPCFQMGAKATVCDQQVMDAFAVARLVGPHALCLWCAGLVDPTALAEEAAPQDERENNKYVDNVPQPSVYSMNAMSSAFSLNDFLFMFTGLHEPAVGTGPRRYHFLTREPVVEALASGRTCVECGIGPKGRRGKGSRAELPLRRL